MKGTQVLSWNDKGPQSTVVPPHVYLELCCMSPFILPHKHPNSARATEGLVHIEPALGNTGHPYVWLNLSASGQGLYQQPSQETVKAIVAKPGHTSDNNERLVPYICARLPLLRSNHSSVLPHTLLLSPHPSAFGYSVSYRRPQRKCRAFAGSAWWMVNPKQTHCLFRNISGCFQEPREYWFLIVLTS